MKDEHKLKKVEFDVIIIGGGLSGLTLALQLKQAQADLSVCIVEKRTGMAPETAFKVGESSSELGSYYLLEKLGLKSYLDENHLTKLGTRFFLSHDIPGDVSSRVEISPEIDRLQQTVHVDRGRLENDLIDICVHHGVEVMQGAKIVDIQIAESLHKITIESASTLIISETKWLVDASGRNSILKKHLDIQKPSDHVINSAWFRFSCVIDIDAWSNDAHWRSKLSYGFRRLSTNHLIGKGYWVWIIPLVDGHTSVGIVADPNFHHFEQINTLEKAMSWMGVNEPQAYEKLVEQKEHILDFKVMKEFAYDCKQFYSAKRWALTGDAGAFMDPLYSPGLDFIALGNTWITDLIVRERNGESIAKRAMVFELTHRELFNGWLSVYKNMYGVFNNTQVMIMKIVWDWATYWSIPNVMFMNDGYTDLDIIKQYSSVTGNIGSRFSKINERMQSLFLKWNEYPIEKLNKVYFNIFGLNCLYDFQTNISNKFTGDDLTEKIRVNLTILEELASEIFSYAYRHINKVEMNFDVNPYEMSLTDGIEEIERKSISGKTIKVRQSIREDVAKTWYLRDAVLS